jgi:hypothetical protein
LYISVLILFGAAILDLSQLLSVGSISGRSRDMALSSVATIAIVREIALSISTGLRFFFFWTFVAIRPLNEPSSQIVDKTLFARFLSGDDHSASWGRWGIVGNTLKWVLLTAVLAIPILQILWRVVNYEYGPVFVAETTMEILVSAIFILKLLLNVYLSSFPTVSRALKVCIAPIFALMIGIGIGVGDLLYCGFFIIS